ncbi:hypothetical protein PVAP13_1KG177577 [Panicum virgatum]|uniref:Uncharacterized protein n=1 Tax=Panicum virgatum TaxID=38727 RepID=A0A8T0XPF7_PANVG|nr:hypothetical protein PVAP13_1KG177577 [Panicum virgatum]
MPRNWLTGISMKERSLIFVGAAAFYAIFGGVYWLQFWSLIQREDTRKTVCLASKALDIFAKNG